MRDARTLSLASMPEYVLQLRRYLPEGGEPRFWQCFTVELEPHRSVLEGILQARDPKEGTCRIQAATSRAAAKPRGCA